MSDDAPQKSQPAPGDLTVPDAWAALRRHTSARIALGRAGVALPTAETLAFGWAHAMARDAIHAPLDAAALGERLHQAGWDVRQVQSQAPDRTAYLRRPDLGRLLDAHCEAELRHAARTLPQPDVALVVGDGLSSLAIERHAPALLDAIRLALPAQTVYAPVTIAVQARVALADDVGAAWGARQVAMLIGERPGLSSPDSLGIYLTHAPRRGCSDAQRNCISNIRAEGLSYAPVSYTHLTLPTKRIV